MSQNNSNSESTGLAIAIAFMAMVAMFLYALAAFIAVIFTILSFLAWKKPLKLGKHVITPEEAHAFVVRGIIGALLTPIFAGFVVALLNINIDPDTWPHIIIIGYILGSIGVGLVEEEEKQKAEKLAELERLSQPQYLTPPSAARAAPAKPQEPFHFATWDDEEENP